MKIILSIRGLNWNVSRYQLQGRPKARRQYKEVPGILYESARQGRRRRRSIYSILIAENGRRPNDL